MNRDFVPYGPSLELKELGFDEPCFGYYVTENYYSEKKGDFETVDVINGYCGYTNYDSLKLTKHRMLAPTFSQAFRFFREKCGYDVSIKKCSPSEYRFEIEQLFVEGDNYYFIDFPFTSYEAAEPECLKKLIEIVKRKSNE